MWTLGYYSFMMLLTCCGRSSGALGSGNILFSHKHRQHQLHSFSSDGKPRIKFSPMISSVTKKRDDEKLREIFLFHSRLRLRRTFSFFLLCGSVSGKLNYKTSRANFRERASCESKVSFELLEKKEAGTLGELLTREHDSLRYTHNQHVGATSTPIFIC